MKHQGGTFMKLRKYRESIVCFMILSTILIFVTNLRLSLSTNFKGWNKSLVIATALCDALEATTGGVITTHSSIIASLFGEQRLQVCEKTGC